MTGALQRYRVMANIVGVVLLVLVLVAIPLRYLGDEPRVSKAVSPIHGGFYMIYLGLTFDLARRVGWTVKRTVLVMLAGTVPFLSFYAERRMTRNVLSHNEVSNSVASSSAASNNAVSNSVASPNVAEHPAA